MAALLQHPHQPWSSNQPHKGHSPTAATFRVRDQENPTLAAASPPSPTSAGHSINLKPYLRKLSLRDSSNAVDLSRSYAENQNVPGLAFYDEARSSSDLAFATTSRHQRSTSNQSNFSVSSAQQHRPTAPYAYPMRHTPRPYTPPIARSYTGNSEASGQVDDIMSDDEIRIHHRPFDLSRRSGSIGSLPTAPHPYHSYSNSSLTRLNNVSQTSLPTSRSRGDTMRSIDTVPSSRTSLEKTLGFFRTGTSLTNKHDDYIDQAAAQAANIQAARVAFAERKQAKERKAEKEYLKTQDRAERRQRQKEERTRRKSETSLTASTTAGAPVVDEKLGFIGRAYDDYEPAHSRSLPVKTTTAVAATPETRPHLTSKKSTTSSVKSTWLGFLAWFRTRLLRMKRKLNKNNR
jgi:hypothetical protein